MNVCHGLTAGKTMNEKGIRIIPTILRDSPTWLREKSNPPVLIIQ